MARIFRFNQQAAIHLTMQAAQQAGLPVQTPMIAQGVQALLAKLYEYGIGLSVDDSSPYFQNLMQQYNGNGAAHNVRQIAPQAQQQAPQAPVYQQPQPAFQQQPPMQQRFPQPQPGPWQQPVVAGAVMPGQPLPELLLPPGMQRPMQSQGITQLPSGPMQAPMPAGLGDAPQGMADSVAAIQPTILD